VDEEMLRVCEDTMRKVCEDFEADLRQINDENARPDGRAQLEDALTSR
jgi:hypothetical protein